MNDITLNLTRKWRSKTFDQIIGQPLSVKILKNSLYAGHFFPVYLFAGQRGCGKTTTARVFAAAINCQKLDEFRARPKQQQLPCLECASCRAMTDGKHPDFIEMDAASHTGVDNVRDIIEAASLLPLLGEKKIYLIDEAHMLSKAAFNAFLKILEEPPKSVLFIMATTDPHKIPDTVRSRCFQLFFKAVVPDHLLEHLHSICAKESIKADDDALLVLIKESEGSVRDAMNMLERVRFSHPIVTKQAVYDTLGYLDEYIIFDIVRSVIQGNTVDIITSIKKHIHSETNAQSVWHEIQEMLRAILWAKYDVSYHTYEALYDDFKASASMVTAHQINRMVEILFEYELPFLKSTAQVGMLEMILLRMVSAVHGGSESDEQPVPRVKVQPREQETKPAVVHVVQENAPSEDADVTVSKDSEWATFVRAIDGLQEPLLQSVFKQAHFVEKTANNEIKIVLPHNFSMFEDAVMEHKEVWNPLLVQSFGQPVSLSLSCDGQVVAVKKKSEVARVTRPSAPVSSAPQRVQSHEKLKGRLDISDKEKWRTANALVDALGGTVVETMEVNDE